MSVIYIETSSVLAWLFGETKSKKTEKVLQNASKVFTSILTIMETERSITRAYSQKMLTASDRVRVLGLFNETYASWYVTKISKDIRKQVGELFPVEPVRTLDALHLATAISLIAAYPDVRLLSFDERVLQNGRALGIDIA